MARKWNEQRALKVGSVLGPKRVMLVTQGDLENVQSGIVEGKDHGLVNEGSVVAVKVDVERASEGKDGVGKAREDGAAEEDVVGEGIIGGLVKVESGGGNKEVVRVKVARLDPDLVAEVGKEVVAEAEEEGERVTS